MLNYILTHTPLLYFVQSLWRDEAFSVLMSQKPLIFILKNSGFEPPVYYILLHYWMKIFGSGEIAVRTLSFIGFCISVFIIIKWADILYPKHWLSKFLPVFYFLNPMLLYYAFEVRTYGWYICFSSLALYSYSTKKWLWFIISSVLAFYTHVYFLPFFFVFFIHWLLTTRITLHTIYKNTAFRSFVMVGILMLPWIIKSIHDMTKLRDSWYFPVNFQLVRSVLGNMFLGYEGTPWYGWNYTAILSLFILGFFIKSIAQKKLWQKNSLYILFTFLPLAIVIGVSFFKPLFVNRYLIPATITEILAITAAIYTIKNRTWQITIATSLLVFIGWFNWWYPKEHPKLNIRTTIGQINMLLSSHDVIYADNPLIYLETRYYATQKSSVFFYNPSNNPFPWYVGDALVSPNDIANDLPVYPNKAYVVKGDGSYEIMYKTTL